MQYSDTVMEHFMNPKNVGKIDDADGVGKVGSPQCGDVMYIFINVEDDIITEIKFKTFGCGAAIASSSVLTEMAKGKRIDEAEKITRAMVLEELGGLPDAKKHCSNLASDGLKAAIKDFRGRGNGDDEEEKRVDCDCADCVMK